jgi:hypothetical protein
MSLADQLALAAGGGARPGGGALNPNAAASVFGAPIPGAATAATAGNAADTALLRGNVADILGLQSKASIDTSNAAASDIQATGYQTEAAAYQNVAGIAGNNATVAGIAGDIKLLQQSRAFRQSMGSQRADVAAAGFQNSGSAIDLMRDSVSQSALDRQLVNVQTAQTQGGYLEEGAAAGAEVAGANMASTAAQALAVQQRASGALATANSVNETQALVDQIATQQNGMPTTAAQTLALTQVSIGANNPTVYNPNNLAPITLPIPANTANGGESTITGGQPVAPSSIISPQYHGNVTATIPSNVAPNPALANLASTGIFTPNG